MNHSDAPATVNFDDFCKQMEVTDAERDLLVHHLGAIRSRETVKALHIKAIAFDKIVEYRLMITSASWSGPDVPLTDGWAVTDHQSGAETVYNSDLATAIEEATVAPEDHKG